MNPPTLPPTASPPVPLPTPSTPNRVRWWIHLIIISALPIAAAVMSSSDTAYRGPALGHSVRGLLITCAFQLLFFGLIFGLSWLASRASCDDLLMRWRGGVWVLPLGIGYSIAMRLALAMVVTVVVLCSLLFHLTTQDQLPHFFESHGPDIDAIVDTSALRNDPAYFWLNITFVSFIVAGFREELWRSAFLAGLRSLWPRAFGSSIGQLGGVAIAAIFFGAAHLRQGLLASALMGLVGFGLGVIMVLHRSIWPAVIAHGCFDAVSFALLPAVAERLHSITK